MFNALRSVAKIRPSHWADCYFHAVSMVLGGIDLPELQSLSGTLFHR